MQSFYFDFNLFKHNAQFIKLNYMPSRQYIIMVYKLSRNMVTKLEKHSLIHTSCVGTWFKYKVLLGLNPAKISNFRKILLGSLIQADGLDDHLGHRVGVAVAAWPSVLQVSITLLCHLPGNPDAATPVCDTRGEIVDGGSLVSPSQPSLVVLALVGVVGLDVSDMVPGEFVNCCLDRLNAALDPHGLCGEVCVTTGAVPVTSHGLGVERNHHTKIFSDTLEEVSADPEVITHVNTLGGSHLVLPLSGHHLSIGSRHPDASIVVGALGSREAILGPSKG